MRSNSPSGFPHLAAGLLACLSAIGPAAGADQPLAAEAEKAQQQLKQSFSNLSFEDFALAPVHGPLYQANAGGRIVYYAPESEHLLFAAIFDRNGVNLTALAQDSAVRERLDAIDQSQALVLGPADAPQVLEFTDPDCPYCRALDRFWSSKAAEGKPVRRIIFFVSSIHPTAASKAEHILCARDRTAAFRAIYEGAAPAALEQCAAGHAQLAAHDAVVKAVGLSGTPTIILDGKRLSGFQQGEIEAWLTERQVPRVAHK